MKTIIILASTFIATSAIAQEATNALTQDPKSTWVDQYDVLIQKYVTPIGVRYKAWHGNSADKKALAGVISAIGSESLTGKSSDEKLAFYLNSYNAWILHRILQDYPTKGPGGGGFFGRNKFFKAETLRVAGKVTSFHLLENDTIRPTFKEPRIHFALNCASASCPPLHGKAFRGETLDATLDALAKGFVNSNPLGVKSNGSSKVAISKIFDWYEDDFKSAGGALAYINKYRTRPFPTGTKVSFQGYQWTLNESR
ncbi:MAG: DUF547 domain-containing protein [Verrucomicrobiales bacterium]